MTQCPHCGQQAISELRKLLIGPAVPARCRACGKKVGVPYSAMLAVIPFAAAILAAQVVDSRELIIALWVLGFVAMAVIHLLCVPLVSKE